MAVIGALESVAKIDDIAQRLSLSTDVLQEFQYAAINTGSSVDTMNRALEILTKRVGEAQAGQGDLLDIAKEYNISLVDGVGNARSIIDLYYELSNAIAGAVTPQEQLRIAAAAFGGQADELS